MKYIGTISRTTRGILANPPPKAVLTTVLWLTARSHPAVSVLALLALFLAWGADDD